MGGFLSSFIVIFTVLAYHLSEVLLLSSILDSLFFIKKLPTPN